MDHGCMAGPVPLPPGISREVSREAVAALPIRRYEGEVVLVENHWALVL